MSSKLSFILAARDLPNKIRVPTGLSSIPDPYIKIWSKDFTKPDWTKLAETKHVVNSSNPDFLEVVSFDWKQNTGQVWRLDVVDYDPVNTDDLIGGIEVDVDNFVLDNNYQFFGKLKNGGSVLIKGATPIHFHLQVENLPKLDNNSGSDPYVECYWSYGKDGETHRFHKTKTVDDARNVKWNEAISFVNYVPGTNQYFTFKVFDEDAGKDDVIGQVSFSVDSYVDGRQLTVYPLNEGWNKATITIMPVVDSHKK